MDKKYQVFISSTYEDLKDEREQAIKAVLEMGHIPVGMEMFSAGDEDQWNLIARQIEASDYYIIIVGHRYGSETAEGISYTEKEYDHATEIGIPTLGFVIDDEAAWPSKRIDKTQKKLKKLNEFKTKVKCKLVQFWCNKDELHGKLSISLIKTMNGNPRVGWVRANEAVGSEVTRELTRLSIENSSLRHKIEKFGRVKNEAVDEIRTVIHIMDQNSRTFKVRTNKNIKFADANSYTNTLLEIFVWICPNLIDESSSFKLIQDLAFEILRKVNFHSTRAIGTNKISGILTDLVALDVLEPSKKKHSISDKNTYWSLTKFGKQVMKQVRRIQLEEGIQTSEEKISEIMSDES